MWSLDAVDDDIVSPSSLLLYISLLSSPLPSPSPSCPCNQDLIDSAALLEEEDLLKPDPETLRSQWVAGGVVNTNYLSLVSLPQASVDQTVAGRRLAKTGK